MTDSWPFSDPPNIATLTTVHVLDGSKPVLLVTHDEDDGMWQVLCGTTGDPDDCRLVSLEEMLQREPGLAELADLPLGWCAWRETAQSPWVREPSPVEDDEEEEGEDAD
jgi:hypothetical protein